MDEGKEALFINGNRNGYAPDQCEDYTCTVGALIEHLEGYDPDLKVFLRNDEGYTYGSIDLYDDVHEGVYFEDGTVEMGDE